MQTASILQEQGKSVDGKQKTDHKNAMTKLKKQFKGGGFPEQTVKHAAETCMDAAQNTPQPVTSADLAAIEVVVYAKESKVSSAIEKWWKDQGCWAMLTANTTESSFGPHARPIRAPAVHPLRHRAV